ncbi:phosphopantothenate--cysteine ligase-like protein [Jaminaea rosea]|uniref:Phosphopantothenate--cysteine ligase-like protein n=1 Tax=Jaminaea rosea TaxID=1569628 RepID=A0A316UUU6_9BASI|nr:phosphopantothenate--cysteine ligase-like protein [Jaminaea rosea]PWN29002.1 phosphopantothenate--cysteine ligase-like protein [Jaminaea rosea]
MSKVMQPLGRRGMYYLAAAVSDFFVPNQRTPQHKIQSGKGSLVIEMDQVPKVLKPMVQQWAPEGFVVSFKLETDMDLLLPKASAALRRYGHQIVIANDLNTRKEKVCFVTNGGVSQAADGTAGGGEGDGIEGKWLELDRKRDGPDAEIEEKIVDELAVLHERWIEQGASGKR